MLFLQPLHTYMFDGLDEMKQFPERHELSKVIQEETAWIVLY